MITNEAKSKISEQLVLKFDLQLDEAEEMVNKHAENRPEDLDDDLTYEEMAELIYEYADE